MSEVPPLDECLAIPPEKPVLQNSDIVSLRQLESRSRSIVWAQVPRLKCPDEEAARTRVKAKSLCGQSTSWLNQKVQDRVCLLKPEAHQGMTCGIISGQCSHNTCSHRLGQEGGALCSIGQLHVPGSHLQGHLVNQGTLTHGHSLINVCCPRASCKTNLPLQSSLWVSFWSCTQELLYQGDQPDWEAWLWGPASSWLVGESFLSLWRWGVDVDFILGPGDES